VKAVHLPILLLFAVAIAVPVGLSLDSDAATMLARIQLL
jgi:hypothetical protein